MTTLILAGLLTACRGVPRHPRGVPAEAVYGGEGAQGVFILVGEHHGTLWQLQVWDRQGQRLGSGSFRLRGFAKARIVPEEILGWENGALHLKDGTWLIPAPAAVP